MNSNQCICMDYGGGND